MTQSSAFDDMDGEFDARLKRTTIATRTSKSEGRELTVSNPLAILEARFSYKVLDRLYSPSFAAIERNVDGETRYVIYEVVGVTPTHYQLSGVDSSMPTLLRKEYLDTIKESWGKSQETWIDLAAIPTFYVARVSGQDLEFSRAPHVPLPGARAFLLSKSAVEKFLCEEQGEEIGRMSGFDLPYTASMDNLIRYHCGFFGFSLDHYEPIVYRKDGQLIIEPIGDLVDRHFVDSKEGRAYTASVEVLSFDRESMDVKWSPVQYVFRHRYEGKLLRFRARTGRAVTVTPGHSLFVLRDGRIQCLPSDELRVGDSLVGSRTLLSEQSQPITCDLAEICKGDGEGISVVGVQPEAFSALDSRIPSWKRSRWRHSRALPLTYWERLGEESRKNGRLSYKGCRQPTPTRLVVDSDLAKLLGYFAAEGHVSIRARCSYKVEFTLSRTDLQIVRDLRRILSNKFGIAPRTSKHGKNAIRISFNHRILARLFSSLVGHGAANKRVPLVVLNSPVEVRRAFLQAWALGDYGVTVSQALMNDVMYMLSLEGTVATVSRWLPNTRTVIEGRPVNARPRFQLRFPRARELQVDRVRPRRGRAEPSFPATQLPKSLHSMLQHPSHVARSGLRVGRRLLEEVGGRIERLESYQGLPKSADEARHDGVYRRGFERYLTKNGNAVAVTQLLLEADHEFEYVRRLVDSELTFYEIEAIEEVAPTSPFVYDVSVPGDESFLAGFGGVFCHNTGSGKSNLSSSLIRRALSRDPSLTVVILDIAGEYTVNLLDLLGKDAKVLSTEIFDSAEEFVSSQTIPESLEDSVGRKAIEDALAAVYKGGVERLSLRQEGGIDLGWIQTLLENAAESGKAGGTAAKIGLSSFTLELYETRSLRPSAKLTDLDDEARKALALQLTDVRGKVHQMSGLKGDLDLIIEMLESGASGDQASSRLNPERLAERLAKGAGAKLNILYLPEPMMARQATERLIRRLLFLKKKHGNKQRVLVVLDEAQEYIPDEHTEREFTTQSNRAVEQLLRQGRKYRVHCWMATQRVARLNVNALQQLHSYFVSTLPRMYDRMVIADAFALPYEVLERSADLGTGEWLFVSFKASKQRNVPVFLKTENNESYVVDSLK
ncbi:MAG: DUF87 domain-containing protein [Nitrososphaerales archaeon]|nr:DUF87 domain-containing protein [Nitrososphaerales archaeon]